MDCPYCEQELHHKDQYYIDKPENFYGTTSSSVYYPAVKYKKIIDMYKCSNEECKAFGDRFYTDTLLK
jgi:hypothetical protein